jgi:integrase
VNYRDGGGQRRFKQFMRKTDAARWMHETCVDVSQGIHTASSQSATINEAGEIFIRSRELAGREPVTVSDYLSLLNNHVYPEIGYVRLCDLTTPGLIELRDSMLQTKSRPLVRRVFGLLRMVLTEAQRRGLVAQNAARGIQVDLSSRDKRMLEVGLDIPSRDEIRLLVEASEGRWRPLLVTAIFTGARSSELRGLTWSHVDFGAGQIRVRQRADKLNRIGPPKSRAGQRDIPMVPMVTNVLREWRLQCPRGELGLVFPTGAGRVEGHSNICKRGFFPTQRAAQLLSEMGAQKYRFHSLRHFYASWCINSRESGGLGLPLKRVQYLLGHSTAQMTLDTYGHLFPVQDESGLFADAEKALMSCNTM